MGYRLIRAKSISYGGTRALSAIKYIVIHYTGVSGDTAKNEVNFFAHWNTRSAGAHFFVDRGGAVYQSIPIDRTAWAIGVFYTKANGAGSLWGVATNSNSVSIELCDIVNKYPSDKQTKATKKLVAFLQKKCPNAKTIIRHWDACGKLCPATMSGKNNPDWNKFKKAITGSAAPAPDPKPASGSFKVKVTIKDLWIREGAGTNTAKIEYIKPGTYTIVETKAGQGSTAGWGRLKSGAGWISLDFAEKV